MTNKNKHSILEFAGILTEEEAELLEKHIKERRAASRKRVDRIREMLRED